MKSFVFNLGLVCACCPLMANEPGVWIDPQGDAVIRRTDVGNNAVLPAGFEPIDLLEIRLDGWMPDLPALNAYVGKTVVGEADLMRMRLVFDGLVSPPGPLAIGGTSYQPAQFGDRPAYGYIELDVDHESDTGGEFMPLARNRYLANVGRFSMSPLGSISSRVVRDAGDIDSDFSSEPTFERSGGEFTLILCGCFEPTVVYQDGNEDSIFDPGELWVVNGRFFERFEAYQDESAFFGGSDFGLFDPEVDLLYTHDSAADQTTITLVFPITQLGAAILDGTSEQGIDFSLANHTSIEEALDDLIDGVPFTNGDLRQLIDGWNGQEVSGFRNPTEWIVRALVGTAPIVLDPSALFVWTDTGFGEVFGDLNHDEISDVFDGEIIEEAIADRDGTSKDADGTVNGQVAIPNFGFSFDINDLNGDGVISFSDTSLIPCLADLNGDGVLNFFDVSSFLGFYSANSPAADLNNDGVLNFFDISRFLELFGAGC